MQKRLYRHRLVKIYYSYSLQEIAQLFKIHIRTVQDWIKSGLHPIDDRKLVLIHGSDLIQFLKEKANKRKSKCLSTQLFCVKCRAAREPLDKHIFVRKLSDTRVLITGTCEYCKFKMNKITSVQNFTTAKHLFCVVTERKEPCIECHQHNVNPDLRR